MARETVKLKHYPWDRSTKKPDKTVEVEYVQVEHWNGRDRAYDVIVKGRGVIGQIERAMENTDRKIGRLRHPGKGRPAWAWRAKNGKRNAPGLYARNRASAVAKMLGYSDAERVKA